MKLKYYIQVYQKKIKKFEQENISIEFVNVSEQLKEINSKLYTRNYFSKTTYFRLYIPELYPQYDKAVYIDSDTIVLTDIANLYNEDMDDNLLAAIPDGAVQTVPVFQEYVEKVVGVIDYNNYFNAGILLMNLKELREYKLQEKFLYLLEKVKFEVAQDQDYLNRICKGRVKLLDFSWNRMPVMGGEDKEIKIVHYNLGFKPWYFDNVLFQEHFWKYAKQTEFLDEIKETDCVGDDRINRR